MSDYRFRGIVIDEEKISEALELVSKYCNELNEVYKEYIEILTGVVDEAIISGASHDALVAFVDYADDIDGEFANASEVVVTDKEAFFDAIDGADKYLY